MFWLVLSYPQAVYDFVVHAEVHVFSPYSLVRPEDGLAQAETCSCNQRRCEICGRGRQGDNLEPPKTDII